MLLVLLCLTLFLNALALNYEGFFLQRVKQSFSTPLTPSLPGLGTNMTLPHTTGTSFPATPPLTQSTRSTYPTSRSLAISLFSFAACFLFAQSLSPTTLSTCTCSPDIHVSEPHHSRSLAQPHCRSPPSLTR
ncbi:hypothetical protein V6N13_128552 [Hibiscus sabdariffa]